MLFKNFNLVIFFFILYSGLYVVPQFGIRTDHLVIYSSLVIIGIYFFFLNRAVFLNDVILKILFFLLSINVISTLSSLYFKKALTKYDAIADLENLMQPIIIVLLTCFVAKNYQRYSLDKIINIVLRIYLIFLSINALFAALLLYIGPNEYLFLIGGPPDDQGLTTIERALSASRSGGVFSQPIDAGIAYSIGLISWLYLFDKSDYDSGNSYIFFSQFILIIIGSILCGSKVSYVLGWGTTIIYIFFFSKLYLKIFDNVRFILLSIAFIILIIFIVMYWDGTSQLWRINQYFIYDKLFENLF